MRLKIIPLSAICCLIFILADCAGALIAGVPDIVTTEVLPRAINGKGLAEDGADLVTGKDCRVIEAGVRKDRKVCETKNSPATKKDFKGLSGTSHEASTPKDKEDASNGD